jgi:hypothetical protein
MIGGPYKRVCQEELPEGFASHDVWNRRLGCHVDPRPARRRSKVCLTLKDSLASSADLRHGFPPITEQKYNNCTSESLTAAYEFDAIRQGGLAAFRPSSRLFLYWQERLIEGDTDQDQGAQIYTGVLSLMTAGVCQEKYWPYSNSPSTRPSKDAYTDALDHKAVDATYVDQSLDNLKAFLSSGTPVVVGILVYPSIQNPDVEKTGAVPLPSEAERQQEPIGGHAIVLVGYDDSKQRFMFRNSWGTQWGEKGYGYLPYPYITDPTLTHDCWSVTKVNDNANPVTEPPPAPAPAPKPTPKPAPGPIPVSVTQCCQSCDPMVCCCSRTRMGGSGQSVLPPSYEPVYYYVPSYTAPYAAATQ